jgi:hypothetical protein
VEVTQDHRLVEPVQLLVVKVVKALTLVVIMVVQAVVVQLG